MEDRETGGRQTGIQTGSEVEENGVKREDGNKKDELLDGM